MNNRIFLFLLIVFSLKIEASESLTLKCEGTEQVKYRKGGIGAYFSPRFLRETRQGKLNIRLQTHSNLDNRFGVIEIKANQRSEFQRYNAEFYISDSAVEVTIADPFLILSISRLTGRVQSWQYIYKSNYKGLKEVNVQHLGGDQFDTEIVCKKLKRQF